MTIDPIDVVRGDTDRCGAQLTDELGPMNLTGLTVRFDIKLPGSDIPVITLACVPNGMVRGNTYSATQGGVTVIITRAATTLAGQFKGRFIVSDGSGNSVEIPSKDELVEFNVHKSVADL